jgi:uncharacterized repeat protein (TIGR03803 family)
LRSTNVKNNSRRLAVLPFAVIICLLTTSLFAQYSESQYFRFFGYDGRNPYSIVEDPAGDLFGVTTGGGNISCSGGCGEVFMALNPGGILTMHKFSGAADGYSPTRIVRDALSDGLGNIYGVAVYGGPNGGGVVFKVMPVPGGGVKFSILHSFPDSSGDGVYPTSLVLDGQGNLYGETFRGGGNGCSGSGCGIVFKLSPTDGTSWRESILHRFAGLPDGENPFGQMVFDSSGDLFGTTLEGGAACEGFSSGCGIVYELARSSSGEWGESVLHAFDSIDGQTPNSLVQDASGNLFGTTSLGGNDGCGTIFELSPSSEGWTFSSVYQLSGGTSDGNDPVTVIANGGNLYVAVTNSPLSIGGDIIELSPSSTGWSESPLFVFSDAAYGANPTSLVMDASGNIFGTTLTGGEMSSTNPGNGVVFELSPAASGR